MYHYLPYECLPSAAEFMGSLQMALLVYQDGQRLLSPEEAAMQAQRQVDRLAAKLRELGIDPDQV